MPVAGSNCWKYTIRQLDLFAWRSIAVFHSERDAHRLDLPSTEAAAHLCTCVFDCNVPLLRRFIKAGISVNAGNFDKRTPLHVAAAEGNLAAVSTFTYIS